MIFDRNALESGASAIGLPLSEKQVDAFSRYAALLEEWNTRINLTRIPADQVVPLQFLDSLLLHKAYPLSAVRTVIDVGTGAGFPGIPIAIAFPHIEVLLIDSTRKKIDFIYTSIRSIGINNAEVRHTRAEDLAHLPEFRERFDCATARAVASLDVLMEWLLPFVRVGGAAVALKGDSVEGELTHGREAGLLLGGELQPLIEATIPGTDIARRFVVASKRTTSPAKYPRPATQARKKR